MSKLLIFIVGLSGLFNASAFAASSGDLQTLTIERHIACGHLTRSRESKLFVFNSQQELDAAKMGHIGKGIDFENQSIVVVADGAKSSTGYSVMITDVLLDKDSNQVHVHVRRTSPDGIVGMAFTFPHDAVVVPKLPSDATPAFQSVLQKQPVELRGQFAAEKLGPPRFPQAFLIKSEEELEKMSWSQLGECVDFQNESLIVVIGGLQPLGRSLKIEAVNRVGSQLHVRVTTEGDGKDSFKSYPAVIAVVDRMSGIVTTDLEPASRQKLKMGEYTVRRATQKLVPF